MGTIVDLTGQRVLVVGASSGIGRVIAQRAVAAGASVMFAARRAGKLAEAVAETGAGGRARAELSWRGEWWRSRFAETKTWRGVDEL